MKIAAEVRFSWNRGQILMGWGDALSEGFVGFAIDGSGLGVPSRQHSTGSSSLIPPYNSLPHSPAPPSGSFRLLYAGRSSPILPAILAGAEARLRGVYFTSQSTTCARRVLLRTNPATTQLPPLDQSHFSEIDYSFSPSPAFPSGAVLGE